MGAQGSHGALDGLPLEEQAGQAAGEEGHDAGPDVLVGCHVEVRGHEGQDDRADAKAPPDPKADEVPGSEDEGRPGETDSQAPETEGEHGHFGEPAEADSEDVGEGHGRTDGEHLGLDGIHPAQDCLDGALGHLSGRPRQGLFDNVEEAEWHGHEQTAQADQDGEDGHLPPGQVVSGHLEGREDVGNERQ